MSSLALLGVLACGSGGDAGDASLSSVDAAASSSGGDGGEPSGAGLEGGAGAVDDAQTPSAEPPFPDDAQVSNDAQVPGEGPGDAAPPDSCEADAHEPDDDLASAKQRGGVSGIVPQHLDGHIACPLETDLVYGGYVDNGAGAGAKLTWDADLGKLELELLDEAGAPLTGLDVSRARAGELEKAIQEFYGNYFYIRVRNPGRQPIPYALTVTAMVFGP